MNTLLKEAEDLVRSLLGDESHRKQWPFHNIGHVALVVEKCKELSNAHGLSEAMTEEVLLAGWFHDVGFIKGNDGHESESARICRSFLNDHDLGSISADTTTELILATRYPSTPSTLQEKIICDADLYHLSDVNYEQWSARLLAEVNIHAGAITANDWIHINIEFLSAHKYFTGYARAKWNPQKFSNLEQLKTKWESVN
jgi:predicted metal-dependent HD superfamily phosphohydrolase